MLRALTLALAVFAASCGGSEEHPAWAGPEELRPRDGILDVKAFRSHAEAVDEEWERDPSAVAAEFLMVDALWVREGSRVRVFRDDLQDDSIREEQWLLELERDGDIWELVSARWEQRCHVGRGHQDFSPELCI